MITQKAKYALKAMAVLADAQTGQEQSLRIEEIAQRAQTPKRFLEHILLELRNAGMIGSKRGRLGGYALIKPARQIRIEEILRLIDGPIAPLPCLSRLAYQRCDDCADEDTCKIRDMFSQIYWPYLLLLESLTLADLGEKSAQTGIPAPFGTGIMD
jgi:Rrf2 family protein